MPLFILKIEMSLFGGSMKDGGSLFSVATSASTSLSALTKDSAPRRVRIDEAQFIAGKNSNEADADFEQIRLDVEDAEADLGRARAGKFN